MRILVTGATGFVASALIPILRGRGHAVRAAVRRAGARPVADTVVVGDIGPETDWREALAGMDAVVHLAARVHQAEEPADDAEALALHRLVNVEGTRRLAESAAAAGVRRMVLVSTIKAVTENGAERPVTDATVEAPTSPYGVSKLEAERALMEVAARTGLEAVVVRPPLVYGAGVGANFLRLLELCRRAPPLPFGAIRNRRSLIHVENLAGAILSCVEHPAAPGHRFLVHDGTALSTPDLIRTLARALGRPARLFAVPPALLGAALRLIGRGDAFDRLAASLELDDRAIRDTLGWQPFWSQEDALRVTAEWFNASADSKKNGAS
ncbi:NAD-dependent dehydratase [Skermanella stibiiresistens SB22]|uniref:NAD-dependent dehydratase n=1 Tax=Skermanella stibiiresistens SB22 TaxID=1385369 RepID=W9H520_9PROT|nr:NAD-dependent epimerase/dehydratase family protein [Skermanella stibiiresistens]EWY41335.1 NAD-dependent dehydratase [Skermanella stibiiresistens SB22]